MFLAAQRESNRKLKGVGKERRKVLGATAMVREGEAAQNEAERLRKALFVGAKQWWRLHLHVLGEKQRRSDALCAWIEARWKKYTAKEPPLDAVALVLTFVEMDRADLAQGYAQRMADKTDQERDAKSRCQRASS